MHDEPLTVAARLTAPDSAGPAPAVVVLQGPEGSAERGAAYAEALVEAGFVTLELALEASPHQALPSVFGALDHLAGLEAVDTGRIGLLGLGSGANAALLAATNFFHRQLAGPDGFAAFLALCPTCHLFNRVPGFELADLVWSPILVATASLDGFDNDPDAGPALVRSLPPMDRAKVRTAVFYGARHGFDLPGPNRELEHPDANRGAGGTVTLAPDPEVAERGRALAVQVFGEMRERPTRPLRLGAGAPIHLPR